jgi:hypothetical protein
MTPQRRDPARLEEWASLVGATLPEDITDEETDGDAFN